MRDLLKRDFGIDLPISGGDGNSINRPIQINVESPYEASHIELLVVTCIYRMLGRHWRLIEKMMLGDTSGSIEKLSFEVKYVEGDKFITERTNFYFDLSNVKLDGGKGTPPCGFALPKPMRLGLPYQFGWLHYTKLVNNEQQHPGLGVSVYYGAPHTKTTIYVYNNQLEAIDGRASPNLLNAEFDDATVDLINANPQATLLNERRQENSCFKSFNIGTAYSAIALSTIKDHFFKIRITVDETPPASQ